VNAKHEQNITEGERQPMTPDKRALQELRKNIENLSKAIDNQSRAFSIALKSIVKVLDQSIK